MSTQTEKYLTTGTKRTMKRIVFITGVLLFTTPPIDALPIARGVSQDMVQRFFTAIMQSNVKEIKYLISRNKELVNACGTFGYPPLFAATKTGNEPVVTILINAGAQINPRDLHANTPLIKAAYENYYAVAHALIVNGAQINAQNSTGKTALHGAVLKDHAYVAELLLHHGANTTLLDLDGHSPLDLAQLTNNTTLTTLLKKAVF
jgi:ankyrin repeat protein